MFHSHQFRAPVKSPFFRPLDDVTLDEVRLSFHPSRYPIDREFDFETRLTSTYSVESNPSESTYPTYSVEHDPSEPSYPSLICLSSDSFAFSSVGHAPPPVYGCGFIRPHSVTRKHGHALGGRHGDDALGGFWNGYLPFDG